MITINGDSYLLEPLLELSFQILLPLTGLKSSRSFQTLIWMKIDYNYDVYLERSAFATLRRYFDDIDGGIKVLEESLCDWREFGFSHYKVNMDSLAGWG